MTDNPIPAAYFITFRTYATWVHGDQRTSVDPRHNVFLTPKIKPNRTLEINMQKNCRENLFLLGDKKERSIVLQSIIDTCRYANWHLYAAHVRTNHVHVIIQINKSPDQATTSLKAYATRYLKQNNPQSMRNKYWARGQSAKPIFDAIGLFRTIQYVIEEQGEKMTVYYDRDFYDVI